VVGALAAEQAAQLDSARSVAWEQGMKPYHEEAGVTIYHGDCREVLPALTRKWVETGRGGGHSKWHSGALVTDPPYGIAYKSGSPRAQLADSIQGDEDTSLRDWALKEMHFLPALVFGSWKIQRPARTHTRLIWDTKGALGMGDLSIPWKPSDQEIYVIGRGFRGPRALSPRHDLRPVHGKWFNLAGCSRPRTPCHRH
jgi:hypothetical protein